MKKGAKKTMAIFLSCLIFFIIDRAFKNLYFLEKEISFLNFYQNPKVLYFFQGSFFNFLFILIFLGLVYLIIKSFQKKDYLNLFALTLIFVGGFSNFWDRLLYDFVLDYFVLFNLWAFNLADLMILLGCFLLIFRIFAPNKSDKIE